MLLEGPIQVSVDLVQEKKDIITVENSSLFF